MLQHERHLTLRPLHIDDVTDLERVLAAAAAGDGQAWTALVDRFRAPIARIARSYGLNAHQVDDVAQETWTRLLCHVGSIRDPRALGAWLATIAHRESLRTLQRGRREQLTDTEPGSDLPTGEDLDEELDERARAVAVRRAVNTLSPRQRALMTVLIDQPQLSYAEVSQTLGMPIGSIGPTRARCLERLRDELAEVAPQAA